MIPVGNTTCCISLYPERAYSEVKEAEEAVCIFRNNKEAGRKDILKSQTLMELNGKKEKGHCSCRYSVVLTSTCCGCSQLVLHFPLPFGSHPCPLWESAGSRQLLGIRSKKWGPCSKPDVWQQNVDEEAKRKEAGKDNLEQMEEKQQMELFVSCL